MTEKEFDALIKRAITEHFNDYIPESEIDNTPHKFSESFENKMNVLMGKKPAVKVSFGKKIIICVAAALVALSMVTLCVGAVREKFINFITNVFQTHTEIRSVDDNNAPLDFSDKYIITADMSEYGLVSKNEDIFTIEYTYENEHCTIIFDQNIKEYYNVSENTEGYALEGITVNGCEGYYIDMYDMYCKRIAWDNGDYIFSISVICDETYEFDKSRLLDIANSVKKDVYEHSGETASNVTSNISESSNAEETTAETVSLEYARQLDNQELPQIIISENSTPYEIMQAGKTAGM